MHMWRTTVAPLVFHRILSQSHFFKARPSNYHVDLVRQTRIETFVRKCTNGLHSYCEQCLIYIICRGNFLKKLCMLNFFSNASIKTICLPRAALSALNRCLRKKTLTNLKSLNLIHQTQYYRSNKHQYQQKCCSHTMGCLRQGLLIWC